MGTYRHLVPGSIQCLFHMNETCIRSLKHALAILCLAIRLTLIRRVNIYSNVHDTIDIPYVVGIEVVTLY